MFGERKGPRARRIGRLLGYRTISKRFQEDPLRIAAICKKMGPAGERPERTREVKRAGAWFHTLHTGDFVSLMRIDRIATVSLPAFLLCVLLPSWHELYFKKGY